MVLHNLPDLPRDHRTLRLLVTSRIRSLPQYDSWLTNHFGGNVDAFDQFLYRHSQNGVWTDAYGILCQATALVLGCPIAVIGTNNEKGYFMLDSVPGSENLPCFLIGYYYTQQHYQSLTTPLMEDRGGEEEKATLGEDKKEVDLTTLLSDVDEDEEVKVTEEEDLASNQDKAALPSTECMDCFRQWTHICAKETRGNENNSGRDGGLPLGLA